MPATLDLALRLPRRPPVSAPPTEKPPRRRAIDSFDVGVLAIFGCLSLWVLVLDLWQVIGHGRVWTGTDGIYVVDQMQYLAWINGAAHHLLASNLFVLHPTPADYFQPAVAISGGLTALGLAPALSLLMWKPVAVLCVFFATRRYVRDIVQGTWYRRAALVLAIFYGSFSVVYGSFGVVGDLQFTFLSWGYTFGLLAVGLLLFALISYDRAHSSGQRLWLPGLLGALASLLHPWQGELLIVIVVSAALVTWRRGEDRPWRLRLLAFTVIATGVALLYYLILGRADPSWGMARVASKHDFSFWSIVLAVGPLALPAALGYRRLGPGFLSLATRLWLPAALLIYVVSATSLSATPLHAFDGVTVPLAVLAVHGASRLRLARHPRRRIIGALAVLVTTVPATAFLLDYAAGLAAPTPGNANFIDRDEQRALRYLARYERPGGVLSRFYLGEVIPAQTGRSTFVGDCLWSQPGCKTRAQVVQAFFDGSFDPDSARALVTASGAHFILADCKVSTDLTETLAPIMISLHRFGCASVYEIG